MPLASEACAHFSSVSTQQLLQPSYLLFFVLFCSPQVAKPRYLHWELISKWLVTGGEEDSWVTCWTFWHHCIIWTRQHYKMIHFRLFCLFCFCYFSPFLKDILPVWKPVLCQKLISGFGYLPKSERFYLNFKDEIRLRLDKWLVGL